MPFYLVIFLPQFIPHSDTVVPGLHVHPVQHIGFSQAHHCPAPFAALKLVRSISTAAKQVSSSVCNKGIRTPCFSWLRLSWAQHVVLMLRIQKVADNSRWETYRSVHLGTTCLKLSLQRDLECEDHEVQPSTYHQHCPISHVQNYYIYPYLKHLQGPWHHHFSMWPVPMPNHSFFLVVF